MEKTMRDHVLEALNNLESDSLKSFRNKLNDCKVKEGYEIIPRGKLERKDAEDLTNLILQYYGYSYGVELTVNTLRAINECKVAAELAKHLAMDDLTSLKHCEMRRRAEEVTGKDSSASTSSHPRKHFVDEHREALIKRVPLVEPILDSLLSADLLKYEDYETIGKQETSFKQMRKLYKYVSTWTDDQKDVLKKALRKHNPPLMEDLERSSP